MLDRFKSRPLLAALAAAAVTALGVGGVAVAQGGGSSPDQSTQQSTGAEQEGATEKADGNEKAEGTEKADGNEAEGSEKADDDGPGGHADEPGNPEAQHEAEGAE